MEKTEERRKGSKEVGDKREVNGAGIEVKPEGSELLRSFKTAYLVVQPP